MDIIKIGGSKINSPELFFKLVNYLNDYSTTNNKSAFFIISAFNKNTKDLKKCLELSIDKSINNYFSLDKKETKQKKKVQQILNQIFQFHLNLFNNIVLVNEQLISDIYKDKNLEKKIKSHIRNFELSLEVLLNEINEILQNVSYLNYYSAKTLDKVISYGEICALNTIKYSIELYNILTTYDLLKSNHIKLNENIKFINALDFVTTDDNYTNAKINEKATNKKLNKLLIKLGYNQLNSNKQELNNQQFTFITQGFIAKNEKNEITTMGMESSNLTAAIICKFFNSKKLNIITDTCGIYDSDPRVFTKYNTKYYLDYKTAYNLSILGLKLLHKEMLLVCSENDIEITYSSIFDLNKTNQITTIIHKQNNNNSKNIEPIFIVNFNFYKYSLTFNNLTDFNNYSPNSSLDQINFYKKDKINLTISYFTETNNLTNKEEVILLTIYKFSKINNDFFEDKILKDIIEFMEIDYKNNITFLIIKKVKQEFHKNYLININQDETFIFDRIKSYFI